MTIQVGDYVKTTEEYNNLYSTTGIVIEDYGSIVVIEDKEAETDDNRLEFRKSDLEIIVKPIEVTGPTVDTFGYEPMYWSETSEIGDL